jgi:hypothetical protein
LIPAFVLKNFQDAADLSISKMNEGVKSLRKFVRAAVLIGGLLALALILKSAPKTLGYPEVVAFVAVWGFFAWRVIVLLVEPHTREVIGKANRGSQSGSLPARDGTNVDDTAPLRGK